MAGSWDAAVKAAQKILGDKAKLPKQSAAIAKAETANDKALAEFKKVREDLKVKLLALQDAEQAIKNAYSQYQDAVDEDDFGLNRKDKDDAKKIADAQKILSGWLQEQMDNCDENFKNLKELDKHLMSLVNYKRA